jgi:hypothetical protein
MWRVEESGQLFMGKVMELGEIVMKEEDVIQVDYKVSFVN